MDKRVTVETRYLQSFVTDEEILSYQSRIDAAHKTLHEGTGLGNDFLGWLEWPVGYDKEEFERVKETASRIKKDTDVFIVIGIGGSYLGARAAIEFLKSPLYNLKRKNTPDIYFAGNSISATSLSEIIELCEGRRVSINVISKSGTTTEPAVAFRFFKDYLEKTVGKEEAKKRIYVTTDKTSGTLRQLANEEGYETFVIPGNIGGRFSVLTAVGLLPIAVSGCDVDALMAGAKLAYDNLKETDINKNDAYKYVAVRNALLERERSVELMVSYEPNYTIMSEWWKQLYGESEGKDGKGLFPASVIFSTDLHSLGQFVQDGTNMLFETVVWIDNMPKKMTIIDDPDNVDGLNFLSNKDMAFVNQKAFEGTILAHTDGGTPSVILNLPDCSEETLGYLFYFFEKACAVSGYVLGVNPFDQPGVEDYKRNMFALLGKPGYEEKKAELEKRI